MSPRCFHTRLSARRVLSPFLLLLTVAPLAGADDPPTVRWRTARVALSAPETLSAPGAAAPTAPVAAPTLTLTLTDCLHMALERHPRIAAARASLAAAEDGNRALEMLRVPNVVAPELPVRRRQSSLGLSAAAAAVDEAERDTVYAVTRTYFTVLYARSQERVARGIVDRLSTLHDLARRQLDAGAANVTNTDVRRLFVYTRLAEVKRIQAEEGAKRALAALREAVAQGPEGCLDVPGSALPEPTARPCREEVIGWALSRRGELVRAGVFAQVTCLEVEAQGTTTHKRMETFAAGSDIHAEQVPQEVRDGEYRPGAIPPEMPNVLAGSRPERMKHAQSLHARAGAVSAETRHLIALEAEDAFLRWEEASREVPQAREAADTGDLMADDLDKDYTSGAKVRAEDVLNARVLASQARSQYNEFLYKEILALADLERITAGAFCAGLAEAAPPPARPAQPAQKKGSSDKGLFD